MTLLPWMVFFDKDGKIITTMPMKDAVNWQAAMVYGSVVIRHYLDDAEPIERISLWTLERMIDRTIDYRIDIETVVIPLN